MKVAERAAPSTAVENKALSLTQQMISAEPDIKTLDLIDEDEFIFLACDGIWNSMSSQEVVDFISERLKKKKDEDKLSKICEEVSLISIFISSL